MANTNYGEGLRRLRWQFHLTQQELAEKLNVTAQTVSKWENGINQMDIATVQQVCKLFRISVDEFLNMATEESGNVQESAVQPVMAQATEKDACTQTSGGLSEKVSAFKERGDFPYVILSAVLAVVLAVLIIVTAVIAAPKKLSGDTIYEKVNPSVFFIEVEPGESGDSKKGGSGFFIDGRGTAVTNFHVIEGGVAATVTLYNGEKYAVKEVVGVDIDRDLAIIEVDVARSRAVTLSTKLPKTGEAVYAIGYPESFTLGVTDSTLTDGIISKSTYTIEGYDFIQTNADITHGNSGGVLVNERGQVVGITTGQIDLGDVSYMNLAIPSSAMKDVKRDISLPLKQFKEEYHPIEIKFMDGDETYLTQNIFVGQTVTPPDGNKREGYEFGGWYMDPDLKTPFDTKKAFTNDGAVYGKWTPHTYTIVFEATDAEGGMSAIGMKYGETRSLPVNGFTKRGFGLDYWDGGAYGSFSDGQEVRNITAKDGETVTLKAVWKPLVTQLIFDGNGAENGETNSVELVFGQSAHLPQNGFTKKGYNFVGWELGGRRYRAGEEVRNLTESANKLTFRAAWAPITYTVRFVDKGGFERTKTFTYGAAHVLSGDLFTPTYGFQLTGWKSEEGRVYPVGSDAGDLTEKQGDTVTLTAVYSPVTYTVEFDTKGGSPIAVQTIAYGDDFFIYPEREPTGYHLQAWSVTLNGKDVYCGINLGNLTGEQGLHFKAVAEYLPISYRVEFYYEKYGRFYKSIDVDYDEDIEMPTLTETLWEGYEFDYWEFGDQRFAAGQKVRNLTTKQYLYSGEELEIYAQWKPIQYTISFDANGGVGSMPAMTCFYGIENLTLPLNTFTRDGYFFAGWKCGDDLFEDGASVVNYSTVAAQFTFVAQWERAFSEGNGSEQSPYLIGSYEELAVLYKAVRHLKGADSARYRLTADIDCAGGALLPVGDNEVPFAGVFDGANHIVKNAVFKPQGAYCGLFGFVCGGTLKNFGVMNYQISELGKSGYIAPVAGIYLSETPVENVFADGEIRFEYVDRSFYLGGFVGELRANAKNCYSRGAIDITLVHKEDTYLDSKIGGFAGASYSGYYSLEGVEIRADAKFTNCYANMNIKVASTGRQSGTYGVRFYAGGFIGEANRCTVENSFAVSDLHLTGDGFDFVGKFAGNTYIQEGNLYGCSESVLECDNQNVEACTAEYLKTELFDIAWLKENLMFDDNVWASSDGGAPVLKAFLGGAV